MQQFTYEVVSLSLIVARFSSQYLIYCYCFFCQDFNVQIGNVVGDVFVSAACVAYYGAFTSVYRQILVENWTQRCKELEIPVTDGMTLSSVLADPFEIRQWNSDGLPRDQVQYIHAISILVHYVF